MTDRYREQVFIYNGIRKILRVYDQMIPEDFIMSLAKAEAAAFVMDEPVKVKEFPQQSKDSIAFLNTEI